MHVANKPKTLQITQIRSIIGQKRPMKLTIRALGLRKIHQTVEHTATPQVRGMVRRVHHLVRVVEG